MIEVLDNNKTTANKVPPIYIFPVCGKKYIQQISYPKQVSQCDLQEDTVTNTANKLADDTSKYSDGKFFSQYTIMNFVEN